MLRKKNIISAMCVFMAMLMVLLSVALPVSAESENLTIDSMVQIPVKPEDKIDSVLKEKMANATAEEKIPVAIWFEDIDRYELDIAVQEKCGISKDEIYSKENERSKDTLTFQQAVEDEDEITLKSYVEQRIEDSKERRERNKLYNNTLRSVAAERYTQHNQKIVSSFSVISDDIIFLSRLTPFMIARVNSKTIVEMMINDSVLSIGYYSEEIGEAPSVSSDMAAMNIDDSVEKYGLTGDGINVLLIDSDYVNPQYDNFVNISYPEKINVIYNQEIRDLNNLLGVLFTGYDHGNYVAAALQRVAKDASIYSTQIHAYSDIEWAIENCDISVINGSINQEAEPYASTKVTQWYDSLVSTYGLTFIAAAGNDFDHYEYKWPIALVPSGGYNVIAVGAYNSATNTMHNYRYNPVNRDDIVRYKPEVVAAAGDTSTATPYVTGIVAMMMELEPDLSINSSLVKAILMASCHSKALPNANAGDPQEYMTSGLTQKQGAGKVDAYKALGIVLMETYMAGVISSGSQKVETLSFSSNNNVNISLAWRRQLTFPSGIVPEEANITLNPLQELQLKVMQNSTTIKSSSVTNSAKQLVYFPVTKNLQYDVYITKTSTGTTAVPYAYAWSVANQKEISSVNINGKFAKNQQLSVTATCNDNTTASTSALNYQWQSSSDRVNWSNISGATSRTFTLTNSQFLKYVRCKVTPKNTSDILRLTSVCESDMKVVIYGDSNLDGVVNSKDASAIGKYLSDLVTFSNEQMIASDVDGNGVINVQDKTLIQKYISDLITVFPVE